MKTMSVPLLACVWLWIASSTVAAPVAPASSAVGARASAPAANAAARPKLKAGLWELTVDGESANARQRQTSLSRSCLSPADVSRSSALLPSLREPAMDCINSDPNSVGPDVTWQIACVGKSTTMKGSGRLHLSAEGYVGKADLMVAKAGAKPVPALRWFKGRWIEPCA